MGSWRLLEVLKIQALNRVTEKQLPVADEASRLA